MIAWVFTFGRVNIRRKDEYQQISRLTESVGERVGLYTTTLRVCTNDPCTCPYEIEISPCPISLITDLSDQILIHNVLLWELFTNWN